MKSYIYFAILALMSSTAFAWLDLTPDFERQKETADLVAVVSIVRVQETGMTNRLDANSELLFREIKVELRVVSSFKGEAKKTIECILYRFPTEAERIADHGKRNSQIQYAKATPWESCLFVPRQHGDYLAYLKKTSDGQYVPATGKASSIYSLLELNVPFTSNPDKAISKSTVNPSPSTLGTK